MNTWDDPKWVFPIEPREGYGLNMVGMRVEHYESISRDAARYRWLVEQAGYFQDGSDTTVTLVSDDATRSRFIKIGDTTLGTDGSTFSSIIDEEIAKCK